MKTSTKMRTGVALIVILFSANVYACKWYDLKCWARKAASELANKISSAKSNTCPGMPEPFKTTCYQAGTLDSVTNAWNDFQRYQNSLNDACNSLPQYAKETCKNFTLLDDIEKFKKLIAAIEKFERVSGRKNTLTLSPAQFQEMAKQIFEFPLVIYKATQMVRKFGDSSDAIGDAAFAGLYSSVRDRKFGDSSDAIGDAAFAGLYSTAMGRSFMGLANYYLGDRSNAKRQLSTSVEYQSNSIYDEVIEKTERNLYEKRKMIPFNTSQRSVVFLDVPTSNSEELTEKLKTYASTVTNINKNGESLDQPDGSNSTQSGTTKLSWNELTSFDGGISAVAKIHGEGPFGPLPAGWGLMAQAQFPLISYSTNLNGADGTYYVGKHKGVQMAFSFETGPIFGYPEIDTDFQEVVNATFNVQCFESPHCRLNSIVFTVGSDVAGPGSLATIAMAIALGDVIAAAMDLGPSHVPAIAQIGWIYPIMLASGNALSAAGFNGIKMTYEGFMACLRNLGAIEPLIEGAAGDELAAETLLSESESSALLSGEGGIGRTIAPVVEEAAAIKKASMMRTGLVGEVAFQLVWLNKNVVDYGANASKVGWHPSGKYGNPDIMRVRALAAERQILDFGMFRAELWEYGNIRLSSPVTTTGARQVLTTFTDTPNLP